MNSIQPEKLIKQQPIEYSTIFVDMNSFFASVEQLFNPDLRGRAVGVSTAPSPGGSIVAASIEAKRFGIRTGTKVAEAKVLCPGIAIIHDSPNLYRKIHREIMDILHDTPCYVRAKSIDEAYLKTPKYMQNKVDIVNMVARIKQSLNDLYGGNVLCSVGVASNIWLAKMGSKLQKPDGLVILTKDRWPNFYRSISLLDMTGINFRMARQLYNLNIQTPWQFYNTSWKFLSSKLGVNGSKWYLRMRGFEVDIEKLQPSKSVSHQITTMPNPPKSNRELMAYINKIAINLGARLRHKGLSATGISLSIRFLDGTWGGNILRRVSFFQSDKEIILLSRILLARLFIDRPVRKLSITLSNIYPNRQLPLAIFDDKKPLELSYAVDKINSKYGKNTIMPLRSFYAGHIDLNRIGFAGDLIKERSNPTDRQHFF